MSSRVSAGSNVSSNQDPRRENRIYRYIPVTNKPNQDPLPDYVSLLGMIFSMLGLMIRMKWAAWAAVYCAFISFANSKASEDTKQMFSSFLLSVSAVVMSYLQNPQPMTAPW